MIEISLILTREPNFSSPLPIQLFLNNQTSQNDDTVDFIK